MTTQERADSVVRLANTMVSLKKHINNPDIEETLFSELVVMHKLSFDILMAVSRSCEEENKLKSFH